MALSSVFHVPIPLNKMVKPNALFATNNVIRTLVFQASMPFLSDRSSSHRHFSNEHTNNQHSHTHHPIRGLIRPPTSIPVPLRIWLLMLP
jgi:hypothetical protein